jgi:hypothetical protein
MYRKKTNMLKLFLYSVIYMQGKICVKFKVLKSFGCQRNKHLKFGTILNAGCNDAILN